MSNSRMGQTERLSRRGFLKFCGVSSAALALTAYTRQPFPWPALPVSASPTRTFANHVFLPVVSKAWPNPLRSIQIIPVFQRNFDDGLDVGGNADIAHWNYLHQDGGKVETVPIEQVLSDTTLQVDENGKTRGKVMKCTIQGNPVQQWGTKYWRALYPDWVNGFPNVTIDAPSGLEVDVFVPEDFGNYVGLLSGHFLNEDKPVFPGARSSGDGAASIEMDKNGNLILYSACSASNDGKRPAFDQRLPLRRGIFRKGKWNTLRLIEEVDGRLSPYVNGVLALEDPNVTLYGPIDSFHKPGFYDGHPGLQAANTTQNDGFKEKQYILNDYFAIGRFAC